MDVAHDSVIEADHVEVDQQVQALIPELDVRQKLRLMIRNDSRDCLGLGHDTLLDQQVDPIVDVQIDAIVAFVMSRSSGSILCDSATSAPLRQESPTKHARTLI
jgi:hypothetical protein